MRFSDFKYIVLCNKIFDAGFIAKREAFQYIDQLKRAYPNCTFTIFEVEDGDERELDRIWRSYEEQLEEER